MQINWRYVSEIIIVTANTETQVLPVQNRLSENTLESLKCIMQTSVILYSPGVSVFVLLKHPFTALYITALTLPIRVGPPTHMVLKFSQETAIKPFPQVTQNQTC